MHGTRGGLNKMVCKAKAKQKKKQGDKVNQGAYT